MASSEALSGPRVGAGAAKRTERSMDGNFTIGRFAPDGSRVAVLFPNGVTPTETKTGWARSTSAAASLYCAG